MSVAFTADVLLERVVHDRLPVKRRWDAPRCTGHRASAVDAPDARGGRRATTAGGYCRRSVAPGPREASPSLVYGAALLMRFGLTPIPGSNPGASAAATDSGPPSQLNPAPVAQRIEHLTTDQKVRGSNPFGRATFFAGQRGRRIAMAPLVVGGGGVDAPLIAVTGRRRSAAGVQP